MRFTLTQNSPVWPGVILSLYNYYSPLCNICCGIKTSRLSDKGFHFFRPPEAPAPQHSAHTFLLPACSQSSARMLVALIAPRPHRRSRLLCRCRGSCLPRPWCVQVELPHLVEQRLVTDP